MFGRWTNYRLRMKTTRQKYYTMMRKNIQMQRSRLYGELKRRTWKFLTYGSVVGVTYYYANSLYGEYHQRKQIKKKFVMSYPDLTRVVEFKPTHEEVEEKFEGYKGCFLRTGTSGEAEELREVLGETVIVFSPTNFDQLCNSIAQAHKYRHHVVAGNYPIDEANLLLSLKQIIPPAHKNKYIVINTQNFKSLSIDPVSHTLEADVGATASQINKYLIKEGYQALFDEYSQKCSLHEIINNNLPLRNGNSLIGCALNLNLVSAEGKRFKSSTEVRDFGQIVNLTPLFLGTGGAMALPAHAKLRLTPAHSPSNPQTYSLKTNDLNSMILQLRNLSSHLPLLTESFIKVFVDRNDRVTVQANSNLDLKKAQEYGVELEKKEGKQVLKNPSAIFSINQSIFEELILHKPPSAEFSLEKDILYADTGSLQPEKINKLIAMITMKGGVLVWCRNPQIYNSMKPQIDSPETGAQLMKKIVEVREGLDKKHTFESHQRYENYFAKGFIRKLTELFW